MNLKDEFPRIKAVPASYIDDDGVTICSGITDNEYSNTNYYLIIYKSSYLYFDERIDKSPDILWFLGRTLVDSWALRVLKILREESL